MILIDMIHKLALVKHHAACLSQIMVDIDIRLSNININLDRGQTDRKNQNTTKKKNLLIRKKQYFSRKIDFFRLTSSIISI